jgi:hypothetical protein
VEAGLARRTMSRYVTAFSAVVPAAPAAAPLITSPRTHATYPVPVLGTAPP